jgi:hypothetical protein
MVVNTEKLRFLALVPHRDTRLALRKYSNSLFNAGFFGAYSFPWIIPLAELSSTLNGEELKHFARSIREANLQMNKGRFIMKEGFTASLSGFHLIYGPSLDISIPGNAFTESAAKKISSLCHPQIVGACVLLNNEVDTIPQPPQLFFTAAAAANVIFYAKKNCESCTYKWKIGKLHWLPALKKHE